MGHAHHFLRNLDRVSREHVELALSLYNDVDLVRHILANAPLPDGADRVALSLDHPDDGPFVIVTREGRFVTCLGAGMRVSYARTPVVTRARLDGLASSGTVLRERIRAATELARGGDGHARRLFARIHTAGSELSREEFVTLSQLGFLLGPEWRQSFAELVVWFEGFRPEAVRLAKRLPPRVGDRIDPRAEEVLRTYWNRVWAMGHLALLGAHDGPQFLEGMPEEGLRGIAALFSHGAALPGMGAIALRGAWAVARLGKPLLAVLKRNFREAQSIEAIVGTSLGLTALGLRHAKLGAEVGKTLASQTRAADATPDDVVPQGPSAVYEHAALKVRGAMAQAGVSALEKPAVWEEVHVRLGREFAVQLTAHRAESSGLRFARAEDVPEEFARTAALNNQSNLLSDHSSLSSLLTCVPYLATADAERFYFPQAQLPMTGLHYRPSAAHHLVSALCARYGRTLGRPAVAPRRTERLLGRNEPCHCGSGTKFKRCHGA